MYKKFAAVGLMALMVTGCVSPSNEGIFKASTSISNTPNFIDTVSAKNRNLLKIAQATKREEDVAFMVSQLKKHVGKTWYVFSGDSPSGWDCSGLVSWTYSQIGIKLEHRASKQSNAGISTDTPNVGDIVSFTYKGSESAYHVGIYIGNGMMIHAPKHGHVTRVENISTFAGSYSKIDYRVILPLV